MPKYSWFNISKRQYEFLKVMAEFEVYINEGYVKLSKAMAKAIKIVMQSSFDDTLKGMLKKQLIEIKGGIPDFSSPYVKPHYDLSKFNVNRIIEMDLEIRINPNARTFIKILDHWFNKATWKKSQTRKARGK